MTRRLRSLLAAGIVFLVVVLAAVALPVPYVVLSPGETLNTLGTDPYGKPIITVSGGPTKPTSGHLNLTTVSVTTGPVNAVQALVGWVQADEIVVPRVAVFPPGQTQQQVTARDTRDFVGSQNSAEAAAFCQLGYPKGFGVLSVSSAAAKQALRAGDQLISLNGVDIGSVAALTSVLARQTPGTTVAIAVRRAGVRLTVPVRLSPPAPGKQGASIGIEVGQACLAPYTVDFGLGNQIGGPSAGLMFALGLIDMVGKQNLTGGRFIAGTGTIDPAGRVGPIGGITLKMIAARRAGATVFLAPSGNCGDVRGHVPAGLTVVSVSSLSQALTDLQALQTGRPVTGC